MESQPIEEVKNLGEKSAAMLTAIGIEDSEQLKLLGAVKTYLAVKQRFPAVSLNLLWAIDAGLQGIHWLDLPAERKQYLRSELDRLAAHD